MEYDLNLFREKKSNRKSKKNYGRGHTDINKNNRKNKNKIRREFMFFFF